MNLLLHNNNQLIKKLLRIQAEYDNYSDTDLDRLDDSDLDGYQSGKQEDDYKNSLRRQKPLKVEDILVDQLENTVQILKFVDKAPGITADEIEAAKEECMDLIMTRFS